MIYALLSVMFLAFVQGALVIDSNNFNAVLAFDSFQSSFGKVYSSEEEYEAKFAIFQANLDTIAQLNAGRESEDEAYFAVNKFADMTAEEFAATHMNYERKEILGDGLRKPLELSSLRQVQWADTDKVDWRDQGAVTDVKDQGQCGSCWAFSATSEIESMWFMAGNRLETLSPQQIVSCDKTDGGCNGGDTPTAYQYVIDAGGLMLEKDYPYTGKKGICKMDDTKFAAKISGFNWAIPECEWFHPSCNSQNETQLAEALTTAPISICVNAEPWQFYKGGVMKEKSCSGKFNKLDHCVQLVGYDKSGSEPYWMVRNSWASDWGVDGYIHLSMGENTCGVADEATIAVV